MIGKLIFLIVLFALVFGAGMYFADKYCIGCMDWDEWIEADNCVIWGKPCREATYTGDLNLLRLGSQGEG